MSMLQSTQQDISQLLESQKLRTIEAIRNYPPPIPACDAQFNYLLEKRDRITVELNRLNQLDGDDSALIDFIAASVYISDEAKQGFRAQLEQLQHKA